jgi:hypothetical protein
MHFSKRTIVGPLALALAAACTETSPSVDDLSMHSSPIQGGTNDTTHTFAVAIIVNQGNNTGEVVLCSGALLAPNLVATARHCVASLSSTTVTCPTSTFGAVTAPANVVVTTDADVRTQATRLGVSEIVVPSGADQTAVCGNDLALLILSQNVTLPQYVRPVLDPPMSDHTLYTPTVTAIGYGESTVMDPTGATAGTRRIRQNIALACIPNDTTFPNCSRQLGDQMTGAEFATGNGTCEGDSGSNAYDEGNFDKGNWVSFGVLSRGGTMGSTCIGGIYTRFDAWSSLLIDAATQAAMRGGYALPPWASADGGTGSGTTSPGDAGSMVDASAPPPRDGGAVSRADGGSSSSTSTTSSSSSRSSSSSSLGSSSSSTSSTSTHSSGGGMDAGSVAPGPDSGVPTNGSSGGNSCTCLAVGAHSPSRLPWLATLAGIGLVVFAKRRRGGPGRPV